MLSKKLKLEVGPPFDYFIKYQSLPLENNEIGTLTFSEIRKVRGGPPLLTIKYQSRNRFRPIGTLSDYWDLLKRHQIEKWNINPF